MKTRDPFRWSWLRVTLMALIISQLVAGSMSPARAAGELALSTVYTFADNAYPTALVNGPQSALWLTLGTGNAVGRLNLPDALEMIPLPEAGSRPFDLTIGADANLWFTEQKSGKIGQIDALNQLTEYALQDAAVYPSQLALGQDGGVWFTEFAGNNIGRIDADGKIDRYPLPSPDSRPLGIASALDGSVWFTEWNGMRIGKIALGGAITEYAIPNAPSHPTEIAVDADGFLWFIYEIGQNLVRVDPKDGSMVSTLLDSGSTSFLDLAYGPDGMLWLLGTDTVSRVRLPIAGAPVLEKLALKKSVYNSEGRSQIIAGPGAEMLFITARSQELQRVSIAGATGLDLQVFVHPFPAVMLMGGAFEMNIEFANWSSSPATDVQIEIPLPENAHFQQAVWPDLRCAEADGLLTCQLDSLAGGGRVTIPFFFEFERIGEDTVTRPFEVKVSSAEPENTPANNIARRSLTFQRRLDYFNDFTGGADAHWSHSLVSSPDGLLKYLGGFDNQAVTLTFTNLPHHDQADICFDLYIQGGWDGEALVDPMDTGEPPAVIGPDLWANYLDDNPVRVTTFSNSLRLTQSYPDEYNQGVHPAQSKANETGNYDEDPAVTDSRYHFCVFKTHAKPDLKYTFYGANLDGLSGEHWALDNVSVKLYYRAAYSWSFLPWTGR